MHILNDFFLLSWNEKSDHVQDVCDIDFNKIFATYREDFQNFCDSCSMIFIVNDDNWEKLIQIDEFKSIFGGVFRQKSIERCLILQIQKEVLEFIIEIGDLELNTALKKNFEILRKEGIITYYISRRLIGLVGLIRKKESKQKDINLKTAKKDDNFYKNAINILQTSIQNLSICVEDDKLLKKLKDIENKLTNQSFSVGVTGVINSGKSTMLNALLKKEILGTAVVPETANLTVLKYAKKSYARVNFWSAKEFKKIQESAKEIKSIEKFINETKEKFKNSLNDYVTLEGRSDTIEIEKLGLYTSAKKSDKKCNLVKSVELYSDLEFLKDGVEIVDTPGLDDPIIQREEITLEYVSGCDLMIHLMNVNQSATKKDIDFIIDSILYQNIAQLLIVITRVDTVSSQEVQEVLNYTKHSIKKRLEEQNSSYKLDFIMQKLEFIPLSGKMALLLRTSREDEAKKIGYDLQKSGILEIENYLQDVLFGANSQKANLVIQSNKNDLLAIIFSTLDSFDQEESLLGKSSLEIKKEYKTFLSQRQKLSLELSKIEATIRAEEKELLGYFKILHQFMKERLIHIKDVIQVRVMDDLTYELRKKKKLPKKERIETIVTTALKDGLIDLVRDYRYEFSKKMQKSFEIIETSFKESMGMSGTGSPDFDSKKFFDENFASLGFFQNHSILLKKIYDLINLYAKKSPQKLHVQLDALLQKTVDELEIFFEERLKSVDEKLLRNFIHISDKKIGEIREKSERKDKLFKKNIENIKQSSLNKEHRSAQIQRKKDAISMVKNELENLS